MRARVVWQPLAVVGGLALAVWLLWLWGRELDGVPGVSLLTGAEPFTGWWAVRWGWATAVAVAILAAVVAFGPRVSLTLRWPALLLAGWGTSLLWCVVLAWTQRFTTLVEPLRNANDYLAAVPLAREDLGAFVRTFTDRIAEYPLHVRGHPPGLVVILAAMDRIGLGGEWCAAALIVLAGSSCVVAVAVTLRRLGGRDGELVARRALPAAVLAPAALWIATSPDAFFAAVLTWGVALLAIATTAEPPWVRNVATVGAGMLLGLCPFLSYGLLPMGLLALVPAFVTRRWGPTLAAGALVLVAVLAWGAAGFWIWDGVAATHAEWNAGTGTGRPYWYFLVVDLVLLAVLVGPAGVGGLARWRRLPRAARALVAVAVVAALIGALGGFERGEVERIWLPLAFWVLPAAATLGGDGAGAGAVGGGSGRARIRGWLVAQGGTALLLETVLLSPW
ncbi:integral membrane protein [Beutenbergia cavernae DSM 12333]|uniref:Integral membrane protein n=1 Tax=Beutenbergia cavernae (strain ATCC BAA-8 / DSM 12333 / CCUG 43141 / JCM 11478 / NBRC 16432 / NCIMB 13614 / HKI 0122) TaxID=471853 RepID=C5C009_BEUC1|nr:hypothetical protein [Beutenbergia cavernae]ACQ81339.1 integral membrane protein [Beutenbergia cavernae DSM 12333]